MAEVKTMINWLDDYGMLHVQPMPSDSENGVLFTVENYMLMDMERRGTYLPRSFKEIVKAHEVSPGAYGQSPWDLQNPASHDNATAIVAYSYFLETRGLTKGLPAAHKNLKILGKFWHPRDIIYYNYVAGGLRGAIATLFLPLLTLIQAYSMLDAYKVRDGVRILKTDGKILSFVRNYACKDDSFWFNLSWKLNNWILSFSPTFGESGWPGIFDFYFKNPGHPNRVLARRVKWD